MFLRLLLLLIVGIVVHRLIKTWLGVKPSRRFDVHGRRFDRSVDRSSELTDDVMVQDPHCGVYFPRRQGVAWTHAGEELLFCSPKCRTDYQAHVQTHR